MAAGPGQEGWAKANPESFYTRIWPRVLPLQLSGDPENPLIPSAEHTGNSIWLSDFLDEAHKKHEREEAAISKWMQENPQATAAHYREYVKKISDGSQI